MKIVAGVVILAAGASARMGRPKLTLPWGTGTVLEQVLTVWDGIASQRALVFAPENSVVAGELDRLGFPRSNRIFNPSPQSGMFSSIRRASEWDRWDSALTHCAIMLGDQPQIPRTIIERLMLAADEQPGSIVQPAFHGRPKHPVIFPMMVFRQIARAQAETLRGFLAECAATKHRIEIDDDALAIDLDTPEDYARARERYDRP